VCCVVLLCVCVRPVSLLTFVVGFDIGITMGALCTAAMSRTYVDNTRSEDIGRVNPSRVRVRVHPIDT